MNKYFRTILTGFIFLIFLVTSLGAACAGEMKIAPKGNKKIKIAVMDLISSIEIAAFLNKSHIEHAKARNWDVKVFDLKANFPESVNVMDNIIAAGYDGVIVHWTPPKFYEQQLKKAQQKGIPVLSIACGEILPGMVGEFAMSDAGAGALSAEYLSMKLGRGAKIMAYYTPEQPNHRNRVNTAKATFENYGVNLSRELYYTSGDPNQASYDGCKNALLADIKKEIKGIWTVWEGHGISAARAAIDCGRKDVVVVTIDDSPNTYSEINKLPTLHATVGTVGLGKKLSEDMFAVFDEVFAGQPVPTGVYHPLSPYLVSKENLPPKGYFFSTCGYKGRPSDW